MTAAKAEHTRQFICKGCGEEVFSFGVVHANDDDVCATCNWLRGIEDPQDRANLAEFLRKAGSLTPYERGDTDVKGPDDVQ